MTLFGTLVPSILALLCLVVHVSTDDTEELTRLAINLDVPFDRDLPLGKYRKTGFSFCNGPIHYYSRNFSQFITQSHVIVDKSLFIKSILESPHKAILFNIPRRWGKSMALNWLKAFLEIEVDPETGLEYEFPAEKENYLIFKRGHIRGILKLKEPLLITKHAELMDKYHGKWPVIHQRLRVFPVMDMENAETLLLLAVANAYYRHSYLLQSYHNIQNSTNSTEYQKQEARELAQKFEVYLTGEMTPEQTVVGLRYLSELLYNHFKRKVFILVDDYDDLINFLLVESWPEEKDKIMQFYLSFLRNTLCDNPYIEKIVATGVSPVPLSYAPDIFGQFVVYGYINNPYWQFFGYHVREIKLFVDYLQITTHNATEMHEWYNGYFVGVHQPHRIYNPHLINFFWETKEHRNYVWEPRSGLIEILIPRFWNIPGFEEIWAVLNSGTTDVTIQANLLDLPYHRFERLINAVANPNNDIHVDGTDILDIIFNYLILLGYFSWTDLPYPIIHQITKVTLRIPNKSFFYRLRNDTFEFYAERYLRVAKGIPSETLQQYGQAVEASFTELVENECNVTDLFRGAFAKFLTIVPQLLRIKPIIELVPESNVSTTPKPPTLSNYPVPATDERLVRSSLYCIFGYSTKRRFRIQDARLHSGGKKTDIILTRGLHAAVINVKYTQENDTFVLNNQTVHEIIDDSYVDIFKKSRHFEHIRTVSLVAVHVQQSEFAQVRVQAWNHIIHW